jgi:hypothetical protein
MLQVRYGNLSVSPGNELTPTQVKSIPAVHWNADDGSYYLLCLTGVFYHRTENTTVLLKLYVIPNREQNIGLWACTSQQSLSR